jgi:hypothetical protein
MYGCIITVKSITYAFKGEALLKNHGLVCKVVKTEGKDTGGCKYGLALSCNIVNDALEILKSNKIEIGKVMA